MDLTSIFCAEDDHLLVGKVDSDRGRRRHTGGVPICRESTGIVDDVVRMEVFELFSCRSDQHVAHEEGMVGASANHTDAYPVALVPAGEAIDDVDAFSGVEKVDGTLTVDAPDLGKC